MKKTKLFNQLNPLKFKHFSRHGYSLFSVLGKEVLVGVLSIPTLTYAKADGVGILPLAKDSLSREEVKLDEVVVTGSRAPLTALQTAKLVAVITHDDIQHAAAQSITDVLKLATGVDVRQRGGFGVQTDICIDGGSFDQVTILLNGINLSSPQTGHNAALFPISIDDIERIEVLQGASSRLFGAQAFSGAINIVTRAAAKSGAKLSAEAGSYGTFGGNASLNIARGAWSNHISGGYRQSDGGTEHSDFNQRRTFYMGNYASKHIDMEWQTGLFEQKYGANTFYSASFRNQYEETSRYMASVKADIKLLRDDALHILPSLYYDRDYDHYQLIRNMAGAENGENYHRTDFYGGGLNAYLSWALGKTAIGGEVRKERILSTALGELMDESRFKRVESTERYYDKRAERTNASFFVEHNIVLSKFTLSAGLLANKNTGLDSKYRFYPGIDIAYRPSDSWKIYASWNKSLRMPTFTDLYMSNALQQGDKELRPERCDAYKVGARFRERGISAVVSGFFSHGKDMIDWVYLAETDRKSHCLNVSKLDNLGASVEVALRPQEWLGDVCPVTQIKTNYSYIHQKHEATQDIFRGLTALSYLRHKFVAQLDHRIWSNLSASWSFRWQERMNGYHPYAKLDGKVQWSVPRYSLYVKADNITAHRYRDFGGIPQPGAWFMAGATINLDI
ncbi:MAG: TonB-dependent receptor [Prevotella sp.]|nr:TonB-dependent receptor [Prevotella sp.]